MRAVAGSRSAIAIAVRVFPEPDSPTIPTISPGRTSIETERTGTEPPGKETVRLSTASTSASPVGRLAAAVGSAGAGTSSVPAFQPAAVCPAAIFDNVSPSSVKTSAPSTIATAGPIATIGVT